MLPSLHLLLTLPLRKRFHDAGSSPLHPCSPLCIPASPLHPCPPPPLCISALHSASPSSLANFPPPEPASLLTLKSTHTPCSCACRYSGKRLVMTGADILPKHHYPLSAEWENPLASDPRVKSQELETVLSPPIVLLTSFVLLSPSGDSLFCGYQTWLHY